MSEEKYSIEEIQNAIKKVNIKECNSPESAIIHVYSALTPENIRKANEPKDDNQIKLDI